MSSASEALEVVRKYTCRWPIEEVHLVLKSGCRVEGLRLESWDRLEKAVAVESAVAARIVSLRDLARETPEAPAPRAVVARGPGAAQRKGAGALQKQQRKQQQQNQGRPRSGKPLTHAIPACASMVGA